MRLVPRCMECGRLFNPLRRVANDPRGMWVWFQNAYYWLRWNIPEFCSRECSEEDLRRCERW